MQGKKKDSSSAILKRKKPWSIEKSWCKPTIRLEKEKGAVPSADGVKEKRKEKKTFSTLWRKEDGECPRREMSHHLRLVRRLRKVRGKGRLGRIVSVLKRKR